MDALVDALGQTFSLSNIFFVAMGIFLGYIVGAIPGLGKVTAAAIAIPLTFSMNPVSAIGFLVGISKGSTSGNAVSAILINTPGEPSSVPTALDGYPLARQGKGLKAMKVALFASTIGDFAATWVLIFLTAPLARLAVQIGLVELASILIFSLTFIAALSGKSLSKGLIS
ncbi:MAG: tripartite tricarboxylate transporter permease, partial [Chloroflexota bacterium]